MHERKRVLLCILLLIPMIATPVVARDEASSVLESLSNLGIGVTKSPVDPRDFELEDIDGNAHRLSEYQGKLVFLNFWATWCGPCRAEMPSMQRLYDELHDEGLEILAVDLQESAKVVRGFAEEYELTFPLLLDTLGGVGALYGARSIPTTYLIDRNGKIFGGLVGTREWDSPEIVDIFRRILKEGVVW